MKLKSGILFGVIFLTTCSVWANYMLSRRVFLRDFNGGVHAYLAGDFSSAEASLHQALERRPRDARVKELLTKVLIERSFSEYHQKNYDAALATLARATETAPNDPETQQALATLRAQLSTPPDQRPKDIAHILDGIYHSLPEKTQPQSLQSLMDQYMKRSEAAQAALLQKFWSNQEGWLAQVQHERDGFRRLLYIGLLLFGLGGCALLAMLVGIFQTYLGRGGVFAQLLEDHYQRVVSALPAGSSILLGPPVSLQTIPEVRRMDIIEAELVSGHDATDSVRRLQPMLEKDNPWVRARAAMILHRVDAPAAFAEFKRLIDQGTKESQLPAVWGLGELGTREAVKILSPLGYSELREIQQATVRMLLQLQARSTTATDVRQDIERMLGEIRSKTGWVF